MRRFRAAFSKTAPAVPPPVLEPGEIQIFPDELYQPAPRHLRTAGFWTGLPGNREEISENFWRVFFWIPVAVPFIFFLGSGVINWFFLSLPIALEAIYFPMLIAACFSYKSAAARFKNGGRYFARVVAVAEGSSADYRKLEVESVIDGQSRAFHCSVRVDINPLPGGFGPGSTVGIFFLHGQKSADLFLDPKRRLEATAGKIPEPKPAQPSEGEPARWLTVFGFIWFFAAILGPPIGWGLTGGLPGSYENGTWQKWFLARLIVGGFFPLGIAVVFCAGSMFYRPMRIAGVSFVVLTLLPLWSVKNTWLDFRTGPQIKAQVIVAFREDDDLMSKWQTQISAYSGMAEGGYIGKFDDGKTADFHCEPVCLSDPKPPEQRRNRFDRYRVLLNQKCEITQFVHLNEIVDIRCP